MKIVYSYINGPKNMPLLWQKVLKITGNGNGKQKHTKSYFK